MKTARVISIALCLLMLVLPCLTIPLFGQQDAGQENRYLADYPTLVDEDEGLNPAFDTDFEDWLRDHFGFRAQAVRAYALADYRLLHTSANASVVAGKGDWLYYADTVPDYTGEGRLSEAALARIAGNLEQLAQALIRRGARLYVAIIPNKSTVYPQYMPERYAMRDDDGNIPLLREACRDLPLTWIDLVTPLRQAAEGETPVFLRTDTHWNALGVAIAAQSVLAAMGRDAGGYRIQGEEDFTGGDLARMMGAPRDFTERVPKVVPDDPLPDADFSQIELTLSGEGEGRLVVYRDSFGTAIGPWLVRSYGKTELLWEYPLDATRLCDDALVLICERHLWEYLSEAPSLGIGGDNDSLDDDGSDDDDPDERDAFLPIGEDDDFFSDDESGDDDEEGEFLPIDEDDDFFSDDESGDDDEEGEFLPIDEDDDFFSDDESGDDDEEGEFLPIGEDDDFFSDDESGDEDGESEDDDSWSDGDIFDAGNGAAKGGGR